MNKLLYQHIEVTIIERNADGTVHLRAADDSAAFEGCSDLRHHRGQSFHTPVVLYVDPKTITGVVDNTPQTGGSYE